MVFSLHFLSFVILLLISMTTRGVAQGYVLLYILAPRVLVRGRGHCCPHPLHGDESTMNSAAGVSRRQDVRAEQVIVALRSELNMSLSRVVEKFKHETELVIVRPNSN